jgi:hypothetical protein
MRFQEILEACWTGYQQQGMKKKGDSMVPNCVPVSETDLEEENKNSDQVRRIQQLLNKKYNANLDVDGIMGPLTLKSIDKFLPASKSKDAPVSTRNTAVQGYEKKLSTQDLEEDLRKWFKEKWVRFGPDGKIRGDCARGSSSEGKPKCLPQSKAHALGKKGRASAAAKKRREDPDPERRGAAKNVATRVKEAGSPAQQAAIAIAMKKAGDKPKNESAEVCPECGGDMYPDTMINEKQDACYRKVKSRYKVWPSAYASGALVQCRKKGAANWGNKKK